MICRAESSSEFLEMNPYELVSCMIRMTNKISFSYVIYLFFFCDNSMKPLDIKHDMHVLYYLHLSFDITLLFGKFI